MTKPLRRAAAVSLVLALAVVTVPVKAQLVVYDPANYLEAIAQYEQMLLHYDFLLQQARRVPVDLATRYHAYSRDWTSYGLAGLVYAQPLLAALNEGDVTGAAYRAAVHPLDLPTDVLDRMPATMQRRLRTAYSTIELADGIAGLAVDQSGGARADGPLTSCRKQVSKFQGFKVSGVPSCLRLRWPPET